MSHLRVFIGKTCTYIQLTGKSLTSKNGRKYGVCAPSPLINTGLTVRLLLNHNMTFLVSEGTDARGRQPNYELGWINTRYHFFSRIEITSIVHTSICKKTNKLHAAYITLPKLLNWWLKPFGSFFGRVSHHTWDVNGATEDINLAAFCQIRVKCITTYILLY